VGLVVLGKEDALLPLACNEILEGRGE
jgi:hypothetical protein